MLPEKYGFISDSIQLAGFYDFGLVGNRFQADQHGYKTQYLQSVGFGTVIKLTKYLSANVYWGFPLGHRANDVDTCRFHFTVTSNIL